MGILLAKKMALAREFYFAIMMDRVSGGPLIIACSEGGTSIEDLAESSPEKIIKVPVNPVVGLTDADIEQVIDGLNASGDRTAAAGQIKALYDVFVNRDCLHGRGQSPRGGRRGEPHRRRRED